LRLARYNIETSPDDSHDSFSGLPTPGAAGAIVIPFLLFWNEAANLPNWFCVGLLYALPVVAVAAGTLMVSRVPYAHFLSWLLKGRKPFARLVEVIFALVLASAFPFWVIAIGFFGYACTGPVLAAWRFARPKQTGDAPGAAATPESA
jgi:CDP-diacylglycerol--serine O-phosphatidyltransferase